VTPSTTPWDLSLRERLALLKPHTHRVAYFAPKPDAASFRYRCYNMSQALNNGSKEVSASYFYLSDLQHIENLADYADSLVIFRTPYDTDVDRVMTRFRRAGKKVFFDIDDLVFDVRFAPLVTSNLNYKLFGKDIDQWFAFISNIGACLSLCDHVITTNSYIGQRVKEFTSLPVSVIPNFINQEQRAVSDRLFESQNFSTGPGLSLGYFSGSHSHAKDFAVAEKGVVDFLQEAPSSTLTLLGHLDLTDELEKVKTQIVRKPFMNFMELQSAIADVDVSLSPLQSSPFTFSKSELKFFEAAVVGTVTVATPTPVFTQAINHEVSGYLSGASQWSEQLHTIEALTSAQRDSITQVARTSALQNYTGEALATTIEALFLDAK
jgi:glycosyltransferase involved in cell wall biosynthesis